MRISDSNTIKSLQVSFASVYPNLKLEFYNVLRQDGKIATMQKFECDSKLSGIRKIHNNGFIKLNDQLSVNELVRILKEVFDLNAVVFRNTFDAWRPLRPNDKGTLREHDLRGFLSNQKLQID